jgi:hypothetical protein
MAEQLIGKIQTNLGFPVLHKVDAATGDVPKDLKVVGNNAVAQAGIPSVLCGFYDYLGDEESFKKILDPAESDRILDSLFNGRKKEFIRAVSEYAGSADDASVQKELEHLAAESARVIEGIWKEKLSFADLKEYFGQQRHDILSYLPSAIRIGKLLRHDNLDDSTNKMEGPLSSLMHKMEQGFNQP